MRKIYFRDFIIKGIVPLVVIAFLTWTGRVIYMTNDSVDWFKACLVYGIPFGIPYMFSVIPIGGDAARSVCILVVNIIVGAVFGCLIAGVVFIRSVIYSISYFVQKICKLF